MAHISFSIPETEQDSRLDRAVKRRFSHIKQVQIEKSLRSGLMRLDGRKVKANHRLEAGHVLTMPEWLATPSVDDKPASPAPISNKKVRPIECFLKS